MGGCENRPRDWRGLPAALGALIEIAGGYQTILLAAAYRALEAARPARRDDDRPTLLLGAIQPFERRLTETFLELHNIPSHRHNLMKPIMIFSLLSSVP